MNLEDPKFVRVDAEQLAALCVSARLPRVALEDHAALELNDGTRLPWLAVWMPDPGWPVPSGVPEQQWMKAVTALIEEESSLVQGHQPPTPRSPGISTLNAPCHRSEPLDVVVTGLFFKKSEALIFVARGEKSLRESIPMTDGHEVRRQAFQRAFELTEQLIGQEVKVGTHRLLETDDETPTVHEVWLQAARR